MRIFMNTEKQFKKPGTKTVWKGQVFERSQITQAQLHNITREETLKCFRRFGGSETITRDYTEFGYLPIKLVSTSPNKQERIIRTFEYKDDLENYNTIKEGETHDQ